MFWWWSRNSELNSSSLDSGIFYAVLFTLLGLALIGVIAYILWDPLGDSESFARKFFQRAFLIVTTGSLAFVLLKLVVLGQIAEVFIPLALSVSLAASVFCVTFLLGLRFIGKNNKRVVMFSSALVMSTLLVADALLLTVSMTSLIETIYALVLTASTFLGVMHVAKLQLSQARRGEAIEGKFVETIGAHFIIALGLFIGLILQIMVRLISHDPFWQSAAFWIANLITLAAGFFGGSVLLSQKSSTA